PRLHRLEGQRPQRTRGTRRVRQDADDPRRVSFLGFAGVALKQTETVPTSARNTPALHLTRNGKERGNDEATRFRSAAGRCAACGYFVSTPGFRPTANSPGWLPPSRDSAKQLPGLDREPARRPARARLRGRQEHRAGDSVGGGKTRAAARARRRA